MKDVLKKRLKRLLVLSAIGLSIGACIAWFQARMENAQILKPAANEHASMGVAGISIDGEFSLTNQDGQQVTENDFGNRFKLVYFGFTSCPDICPTEMQKMTKVINDVDPEAKSIQPIFISIDPVRDTPEVIKTYLTAFHPGFVGLTGTETEVDEVIKNFKAYAKKVESEEASDYLMDHSSFVYLMNPENQLISIYRLKDDFNYITQDINRHLKDRPVL